MRWLPLSLFLAIAVLQYPLWLGKGSWLRVWELDRKIQEQQATNHSLQERNDALAAEVRDLKEGFDALEERARSDLGMVRKQEIFYQVWAGDKP